MNKVKKLIITLVILCLFAFMALGSGSTTPEKVTSPSENSVSAESTSAATASDDSVVAADSSVAKKAVEAPPESFKVGDTVKMEDLTFTLNSVKWSKGSEFSKPAAGEKWIVVNGTIVNNGKESVAISSMLMFKMYDSEGYQREMQLFAETKGSLDGELGATRKMRGELAFTVKSEQTDWEFIFEPNVIGSGQAIFKIAKSDVK